IAAARDILRAADLLPGAVQLIACPTCGRTKTDLTAAAERIAAAIAPLEQKRIRAARAPENTRQDQSSLTVAVMGCAVNGPGEAAHADAGVAFGDGRAVLFRKGEQIGTVDAAHAAEALLEIVYGLGL
ncbi:MAG: flavodoxin-dependent (E)-4-hydroxy-3-methylbut-2-enyl-diphosphate synthase, partial [Clostridiales bacterium]|nr:flavodoxin-dependent (E)-4-hydroxy-3-methylbut-2-enyl-diphosphate synthase [Clostridiales bacterium]